MGVVLRGHPARKEVVAVAHAAAAAVMCVCEIFPALAQTGERRDELEC